MKYLYMIIGVGALVALVILGLVFVSGGTDTIRNNKDTPRGLERLGGGLLGPYENPAARITRTSDGYTPEEVTISAGEAVSFVNESDEYHWPASDIHPTHSIYSEFDPRAPVAPGDTWTFVFEEPGEWAFHDHLRANRKGTVHVTE